MTTVEGEKARGAVPRAALPRVLIVDDQPTVCMVAERILASAHEVTAVTSAKDALRLIEGGERFDVILSDLMMPDMSGMDLHAQLLRVASEQAGKMVFMTGGAFSQEASAFLSQVLNPSIEKPFRPSELRQIVQTLLR
jgi:CheY-like chemotaxis protein